MHRAPWYWVHIVAYCVHVIEGSTKRNGCLREEIISKGETRPLNGRKCGVTFLLVVGFQQVTPHSAPPEERNHLVISVLLFLFSKSLFHKAFTLK